MTPDKFAKRMAWYAETFEANTARLLDKVALTVHSVVVLGTPVDTGRARGSWFIEIGRPAEGTAEAQAEFGFAASRERAERKLAGNDEKSSFLRPQRDIHITNNLPYIEPLNNGHSSQAPKGFVEEAVAAGVKQVRGAKLIEGGNSLTVVSGTYDDN